MEKAPILTDEHMDDITPHEYYMKKLEESNANG